MEDRYAEKITNEVWCSDITYVWAQGHWHYLAAVIDLFARQVVGWVFSSKPDADLVIKALDMAYEQRGRPQNFLFHSDSKNVIANVSGRTDPHSDGPIRDDLAS